MLSFFAHGIRTLLFVVLFIAASVLSLSTAYPQTALFNLNIKNGLPSNHVYRVLSDRHGYLWLATTKGIVKYNGYSSKVFDATTGIPNDDIWNLFEDKKGRIWLSSISTEFGYIHNDQYHKVAFEKDPFYIYPEYVSAYEGGINFWLSDRKKKEIFCLERNDTVQTVMVIEGNPAMHITDKIHSWKHDAMIIWRPNGNVFEAKFHLGRVRFKKIGIFSFIDNCEYHGNYIIQRDPVVGKVRKAFDLRNGEIKRLPYTENENRNVLLYYKRNYYSVTNKCMYKFDSNMNLVTKIYNSELEIPFNNSINYTMFAEEDMWGKCFCTNNAGLFINVNNSSFRRSDVALAGYTEVGSLIGGIKYYWSAEMRALLRYCNGRITTRHYPDIVTVHRVLNTIDDRTVLLSNENAYFIANNVLEPVYKQHLIYQKIRDSIVELPPNLKLLFRDGFFDSKGSLKGAVSGYGLLKVQEKKDTILLTYTDSSRYENIVHYKYPFFHIVYGKNTILIDNDSIQFKIDNTYLQLLGIRNISKLLVDTVYGDIFIHCSDKFFAYNVFTHQLKELFSNYNLNSATMHLAEGKLVAIGRFGVAYCMIKGRMQFSSPLTTINYKNVFYTSINNTSIIGSTIYLDTDMGMYEIAISDSLQQGYRKHFDPGYKLFASTKLYNDNVTTGDTIAISQDDPVIMFDFINPYGFGTVRYQYEIDNVINKMHHDAKLNFPDIVPGKYYTLHLTVCDDLWRTRPFTIYIYAVPYWWQTQTGRGWLLTLSFIGLGLLSVGIILGTKRVLTKQHLKQSRYREFELKSIYGQLNPHFIFNTLTNIIYFIQKDMNKEAHRHLSAFAKLLRAYIKSSRTKLLSIAEEVENLNNYILLQQSRFEDKFDYSLTVDENLDVNTVFIPSLLLQPIIENAIHHGLQQKETHGTLSVSFKKGVEPNVLIIVVDDDGIGRAEAQQQRASDKSESYGSDIIRDLITVFESYNLFKIDIQYIDKTEPLTGTTVIIIINYKS